jgi:CRP-like cAMP-binding protein
MPLVRSPGGFRERALAKLLPQNGLLAVLPEDVRERLLPQLALTDLPAGQQLGQADGTFARAYFPVQGVVALVEWAPGGGERIRALVGREGVVGVPDFIGEAGVTRVVVQAAGYGLALGSEALLEEWSRGGEFMRALLQYKHALAVQDRVLASCRGVHTLEQRLASLLALCAERDPGQEVVLAQEPTASLLGAAPAAVAAAVDRLSASGAARWLRPGLFAVHDTAPLHSLACRCGSWIGFGRGDVPADDDSGIGMPPPAGAPMRARAGRPVQH